MDNIKSPSLVKENSKTTSNTKVYNESNKSKDKIITHHAKVLSMPKLTINNNVINNITVINNGNNSKTITTCNKNIINEIGYNLSGTSRNPNDYNKKIDRLNQKYTRNINNNIIVGSHKTTIHTKTTNTLDIAKEILNNHNKFVITNFTSAKVTPLSHNKLEQPNSKKLVSMTSRKLATPKGLIGIEKNFQTIDVNIQVNF